MNRSKNSQRYFIGIGCRRGCSETSLRELLDRTLHENAIAIETLAGIATIDSKRDEAGLLSLATNLKLPLHFFSAVELNRFSERVDASALIVLLETGAANIAEASALALAEKETGQAAELIVRKCKNADSTLALATATNLAANLKLTDPIT